MNSAALNISVYVFGKPVNVFLLSGVEFWVIYYDLVEFRGSSQIKHCLSVSFSISLSILIFCFYHFGHSGTCLLMFEVLTFIFCNL